MEKFCIEERSDDVIIDGGGAAIPLPLVPLYFIASEPPDKLVLQEIIPDGGETFTFILSYCFPPEHFGEISRYQEELELAAGRKGHFAGNVVIDLSRWTEDPDSPFLDAFLAYLFDHGEKVRYVFVTVPSIESEGALYRKLCGYFPVEMKQADLCSAGFLSRHICNVFGELIDDKTTAKYIYKLCTCLAEAAKQYDLTLRPLETACERLIRSTNGKITSKAIENFLSSEYFIRMCASQERPFGITVKEERW